MDHDSMTGPGNLFREMFSSRQNFGFDLNQLTWTSEEMGRSMAGRQILTAKEPGSVIRGSNGVC
jgi:hypothetical protein